MIDDSLAKPNAVDVAMHRYAATHHGVHPVVGAALDIEGTPPFLEQLRTHVADRARNFAPLTHDLASSWFQWRWRSRHLEPARHVHERTLPTGADIDAELRDIMAHPLPQHGPPWDIWLITGHLARRYTVCYRVHHAIQDGGAIVMTFATLFGPGAPSNGETKRQLWGTPRGMLRAASRLTQFVRGDGIWRDPSHPLEAGSVLDWVDVPASRLEAIGRAQGGTATDAYLAALAGALRTWSEQNWPRAAGRALPTFVPVNYRRADERRAPGNRILPAMVRLPCDRSSPTSRLEATVLATRAVKAQRRPLRAVAGRMPKWAARLVIRLMTTPRNAMVDASSVALGSKLSLFGNPVRRVQPITFMPAHHPVSAVLCRYDSVVSVCFAINRALPAGEQLPAMWLRAVEELETALGLAPTG